MKVALCFMISYDHCVNKEKIWTDWIEPNKDIINVYFHYKDYNKITSSWIKSHAIPYIHIKPTSYYSVVSAYLSLFFYAYKSDETNTWFCMLTESCVPIISPEKFRKLFFTHYLASIIKCKPAYWNIDIHRRANLRCLSKKYHLANDPWFTLTRSHIKKCILFMKTKSDIFQTVNSGGLANESLFAIILQTYGELELEVGQSSKHLINEPSNICDWSRMPTPTSPYTFSDARDENIQIIYNLLQKNKYVIFLRKVSPDFPDNVIKDIMDIDFHHKYTDNYHENTIPHMKNIGNIISILLFGLFIYYLRSSQ